MKGVAGTNLKMWLISSPASSSQSLSPSSSQPAYINLAPVHSSKFSAALGPSFMAMVLLENPVGQNRLTYGQLVREVSEGTIYDGNSTIVKAGFHIPPP